MNLYGISRKQIYIAILFFLIAVFFVLVFLIAREKINGTSEVAPQVSQENEKKEKSLEEKKKELDDFMKKIDEKQGSSGSSSEQDFSSDNPPKATVEEKKKELDSLMETSGMKTDSSQGGQLEVTAGTKNDDLDSLMNMVKK